jgi:hypothetical protein
MPADGNSSAKIEEKRKAHELGGKEWRTTGDDLRTCDFYALGAVGIQDIFV